MYIPPCYEFIQRTDAECKNATSETSANVCGPDAREKPEGW
jgi:hypothetical protein